MWVGLSLRVIPTKRAERRVRGAYLSQNAPCHCEPLKKAWQSRYKIRQKSKTRLPRRDGVAPRNDGVGNRYARLQGYAFPLGMTEKKKGSQKVSKNFWERGEVATKRVSLRTRKGVETVAYFDEGRNLKKSPISGDFLSLWGVGGLKKSFIYATIERIVAVCRKCGLRDMPVGAYDERRAKKGKIPFFRRWKRGILKG